MENRKEKGKIIMNGNKKLIITILLSGIATFIGYLINFFLTPYITDLVGIDAYGFVSIAKTMVSYFSIIAVALTTFIVRFISVSYLRDDYKTANIYYSSSIIACVCLAFIISIAAIILTIRLDKLLNIPNTLIGSVKVLVLLIFMNFITSTVSTPYSTSFFVKNRLDYFNVIKIFAYIADAIVLVVLFKLFSADIWFVGVGSLTSSVVTLIGYKYLTKHLTPELKYDKRNFSLKCVKEIVSNGIWQSINNLGNILNSGLDLIISNKLLSAVQTGQIAVVKTIGSMFTILYTVISQPFQPKLLKTYSSNNIDAFLRELKKSMKICGSVSNIAFAGFIALGELYYKLWLPTQNYKLLYWLTVIAIFQSITEGYAYPIYYIYTLTLKKKIPCFITIISGVVNVGAMVLLLSMTEIGCYAIVLTTAVIMTGINLVFNPMYSMKCLGLKLTTLFPTILRHIVSAIIMTFVFCELSELISPTSWMELICSACIMILLGFVIHFFAVAERTDYNRIIAVAKRKNIK